MGRRGGEGWEGWRGREEGVGYEKGKMWERGRGIGEREEEKDRILMAQKVR